MEKKRNKREEMKKKNVKLLKVSPSLGLVSIMSLNFEKFYFYSRLLTLFKKIF